MTAEVRKDLGARVFNMPLDAFAEAAQRGTRHWSPIVRSLVIGMQPETRAAVEEDIMLTALVRCRMRLVMNGEREITKMSLDMAGTYFDQNGIPLTFAQVATAPDYVVPTLEGELIR